MEEGVAGLRAVRVSVYSFSHFLVDFACAFLMFHALYAAPGWMERVLVYNFFAFAMQMPLGLLVDKANRNALIACGGCALVAAGYGLTALPMAAAIAAGVGNGLFHLGAGVDVLHISGDRCGPLGVFVSPGALGIYLGALLGRQAVLTPGLIVAWLGIGVALMLAVRYLPQNAPLPDNAPLGFATGTGVGRLLPAAGMLLAVVVLRSAVGMSTGFAWKGDAPWGLLLVGGVALGKALGGIAADGLGHRLAAGVSLLAAAVLFLFSHLPLAGVLAVLLFNMTMPITLYAMTRLFPNARGFAFGLLTFGLFLGFLPAYLGVQPTLARPWALAAACVASLGLLAPALNMTLHQVRDEHMG